MTRSAYQRLQTPAGCNLANSTPPGQRLPKAQRCVRAAQGGGRESAAASQRSQAGLGFLTRLPERRTAPPLPLLKANAAASCRPSRNSETDREHRLPSVVFLGSSVLVAHNSAAAETAYLFLEAGTLWGLALKWLSLAARKRSFPLNNRAAAVGRGGRWRYAQKLW